MMRSSPFFDQGILDKLLLKLTEKSHDVFWIRSMDYSQQIFISAAYERVWGRSCQELYLHPESWTATVYPEDLKRMNDSLQKRNKAIQADEVFQAYYRIIRPNGELRWIKDVSYPIFDSGVLIGFAGLAQDITVDKQREDDLRKAKEKVEVANQAKADFIAAMSHDFRTGIAAILGMSEVLQQHIDGSEAYEYTNNITESAKHLLKYVENILDYVSVENNEIPLAKKEFNFYELVVQAVNMNKLANTKRCFHIDYGEALPQYVVSDDKRIYRILINLLHNAVKFTSDDGVIKVQVSYRNVQHDKGVFIISVEDNGVGIPENKLDYIFEQFAQIKNNTSNQMRRGVGLGLTIVKRFIKDLGGEIAVKSQLGHGTTFVCEISLEIVQGDALDQQKEVASYRAANIEVQEALIKSQKLKVLLIEDNPVLQKIALHWLKFLDVEVDTATSCEEARAYINQRKPYQLIISDIGLPDGDGIELAKEILHETCYQAVPIIALTAHIGDFEQQCCLDAGIKGFLKKPTTKDELVQTIYSVLYP